jgi:hypothetical protein
LQDRNLIIPITADLSGTQGVRAVGAFLKEINEKVSALYVSNVEFYLWRYDTMPKFVENLKTLPIDDRSVIMLEDYASDRPYDSYWDLATRRSLDLRLN